MPYHCFLIYLLLFQTTLLQYSSCIGAALNRYEILNSFDRLELKPTPKIAGAVLPILPTFCYSDTPTYQPYYVNLEINGKAYSLLLDTGSSNTIIASSSCSTCKLAPKFNLNEADILGGYFNISYGTGSAQNRLAQGNVTLTSLTLQNASFGVILEQDTNEGFNLFAAKGSRCYNTYAGVLGLAYKGQGAGPSDRNSTINGTIVPIVDQFIDSFHISNAFAIETYSWYPYDCEPQERNENDTWIPTLPCRKTPVGWFSIGGYDMKRIEKASFDYIEITDEIHYNVRLLEILVCGRKGCKGVPFPDRIDGKTEEDCYCTSETCKHGTVEYCYFTVLDSGSGRIYMNTFDNALALISTMQMQELVSFPYQSHNLESSFYFNKTRILGAEIYQESSITLRFQGISGQVVDSEVNLRSIFRETTEGLVQWGIQGDLDLISAYQSAKFPTILGSTFFQGKALFFDRGRRRIGIGSLKSHPETKPSTHDFNIFGNYESTPGIGCRRGTGSGGGCNQV